MSHPLDLKRLSFGNEISPDVGEEWENSLIEGGELSEPGFVSLGKFHTKLPHGSHRRVVASMIHDKIYDRKILEMPASNGAGGIKPSELLAKQSLREFWGAIDKTIHRLRLMDSYLRIAKELDVIDIEKAKMLLGVEDICREEIEERSKAVVDRINRVVGLPTYWALRIKGYQKSDLVD
ncbi:hypothetical protein M0P48_00790 [Candidatus Gracilibacteria bacterium]|jgi:hypothetical protein|nr:hypothetical protein [Candidatus Gracilibacteria bacterium]